ncbi:MAG: hypothetical protein DRP03_01255 [Candidatus Aenigmatarchaeota archaeon]|nr:MAG: hypothetical protein DRP03_01255 [Candidatus Aenigmarchaeota archaeon]
MLVLAVLIIVIIVALFFSWNKINEIRDLKIETEAGGVLANIKDAIEIAYIEGDGFAIMLSVPEKINSMDYSVKLEDGLIILNISQRIYMKSVAVKNITGNIKRGLNVIKNVNGSIVINS